MARTAVVYDEYLLMLKETLEKYQVFPEDIKQVLQNFSETDLSTSAIGETIFNLSVERSTHPINWQEKKGKIFEIIGPNMRNKTSTLMFIATMCGYDWDENEPYLRGKNLLKQAKLFMDEISRGTPVSLLIQNDRYRFEVTVRDAVANAVWWDKVKLVHIPHNDISLSSSLDWREYRYNISGYFDIQVVAVGRNFVAQVGFEEATNLAMFCEEAKNFIVEYSKLLLADKPKLNPVVLRSKIQELTQKIAEDNTKLKGLISSHGALKAQGEQLRVDLDFTRNCFEQPEIREILKLANQKNTALKVQTQIRDLDEKTKSLEQERKEFKSIVDEGTSNFEGLSEKVSKLKDKVEYILPNLTLPDEIKEPFIDSLRNFDVTKILDMAQHLLLDEESPKALELLSEFNFKGLTLPTKLLGLFYFNKPIQNISDFKIFSKESSENARLLSAVNEAFKEVVNQLNEMGINSSEKYQEEIQGLETLRGFISEKEVALRQAKVAKEKAKRELKDILAQFKDSFDSLKVAYEQAKNSVRAELIVKLEEIAENHNVTLDTSLLDILVSKEDEHIGELQEKQFLIIDLERLIESNRIKKRQLKQKLDSIDESNNIDTRVNSLKRVTVFLLNIAEYCRNKRKHFENPDNDSLRKYTNCQEFLGDNFLDVINLINLRIRERCPFAFVNGDNNVVEKRAVLEYDFLNGNFSIEGLEETAHGHGGITSSMTVYGLATKRTSGDKFGSILLVDEWGDVGVYKDYVFDAISKIEHLAMAVFVDVDNKKVETVFEARRR